MMVVMVPPLLPTHVRPASNAILLLLSDVRRHCAGCNRDMIEVVIMKGMSVYHHLLFVCLSAFAS